MHELSLISDLLKKIEVVAKENDAESVAAVRIKLGALAHISPEHFTEHFRTETKNTITENARLDIEVGDDMNDPNAQDILLLSVDINE